VDHPIPFANGKLYMKLLSPARVLDWMYTDSLRHNGGTTTVPSTLVTNSKKQPSSVKRKPVLAPSFLAQRGQQISLVKE
jgi:hypothetical protein